MATKDINKRFTTQQARQNAGRQRRLQSTIAGTTPRQLISSGTRGITQGMANFNQGSAASITETLARGLSSLGGTILGMAQHNATQAENAASSALTKEYELADKSFRNDPQAFNSHMEVLAERANDGPDRFKAGHVASAGKVHLNFALDAINTNNEKQVFVAGEAIGDARTLAQKEEALHALSTYIDKQVLDPNISSAQVFKLVTAQQGFKDRIARETLMSAIISTATSTGTTVAAQLAALRETDVSIGPVVGDEATFGVNMSAIRALADTVGLNLEYFKDKGKGIKEVVHKASTILLNDMKVINETRHQEDMISSAGKYEAEKGKTNALIKLYADEFFKANPKRQNEILTQMEIHGTTLGPGRQADEFRRMVSNRGVLMGKQFTRQKQIANDALLGLVSDGDAAAIGFYSSTLEGLQDVYDEQGLVKRGSIPVLKERLLSVLDVGPTTAAAIDSILNARVSVYDRGDRNSKSQLNATLRAAEASKKANMAHIKSKSATKAYGIQHDLDIANILAANEPADIQNSRIQELLKDTPIDRSRKATAVKKQEAKDLLKAESEYTAAKLKLYNFGKDISQREEVEGDEFTGSQRSNAEQNKKALMDTIEEKAFDLEEAGGDIDDLDQKFAGHQFRDRRDRGLLNTAPIIDESAEATFKAILPSVAGDTIDFIAGKDVTGDNVSSEVADLRLLMDYFGGNIISGADRVGEGLGFAGNEIAVAGADAMTTLSLGASAFGNVFRRGLERATPGISENSLNYFTVGIANKMLGVFDNIIPQTTGVEDFTESLHNSLLIDPKTLSDGLKDAVGAQAKLELELAKGNISKETVGAIKEELNQLGSTIRNDITLRKDNQQVTTDTGELDVNLDVDTQSVRVSGDRGAPFTSPKQPVVQQEPVKTRSLSSLLTTRNEKTGVILPEAKEAMSGWKHKKGVILSDTPKGILTIQTATSATESAINWAEHNNSKMFGIDERQITDVGRKDDDGPHGDDLAGDIAAKKLITFKNAQTLYEAFEKGMGLSTFKSTVPMGYFSKFQPVHITKDGKKQLWGLFENAEGDKLSIEFVYGDVSKGDDAPHVHIERNHRDFVLKLAKEKLTADEIFEIERAKN